MGDKSTVEEIEKLRDVLKMASHALDNWVVQYASDMSLSQDYKEAMEEIAKAGGTLAYIASIQSKIQAILYEGKE